MSAADVLDLIKALDEAFTMGGQLVAAAIAKKPELDETPLPALDGFDAARAGAVTRAGG